MHHNTIILSHFGTLVKGFVDIVPNFSEINKKFLLSFYNLPIEKLQATCYNIDTRKEGTVQWKHKNRTILILNKEGTIQWESDPQGFKENWIRTRADVNEK